MVQVVSQTSVIDLSDRDAQLWFAYVNGANYYTKQCSILHSNDVKSYSGEKL